MIVLRRLRVRGFRAYTKEQEFVFDNPAILLFGENHCGKSSTLNAIEWCLFGNECVGKETGIRERVDWEIVNRNMRPPDALVVLEFEDKATGGKLTVTRRWVSARRDELKVVSPNGQELTGQEVINTYQVLDGYLAIGLDNAGYDHKKKQLGVDITVRNTSEKVIGIPVWVVIESISEPNVTLADVNTPTTQGKTYAHLSDLLPDGRLEPGKSITKRIYFYNPEEVRFTFEPSVRGVILEVAGAGGFGAEGLGRLSEHWLEGEPSLDVAPPGGDGIINLHDFAVFANRWLEGD